MSEPRTIRLAADDNVIVAVDHQIGQDTAVAAQTRIPRLQMLT